MRIKYNNEYYRIVESDIPKTFQEFIDILPEIVSPEPLSPKYHLRYRDLQNFPMKVSNQISYKGLLKEKMRSQDEIILFVTTEEQDEGYRNMNMAFDGQANYALPLPNMSYLESNQIQSLAQDSLIIVSTKQEVTNLNPIVIEEEFVAKSEHLEGDNIEKLLRSDISKKSREFDVPAAIPAQEDMKLGTSEFDVLKEGLSDRLEKFKEKETDNSEKKGVGRRDQKYRSKLKDSKEAEKKFAEKKPKRGLKRKNQCVDEEDDEAMEVVKKKLQTLPVRNMDINKADNLEKINKKENHQMKKEPKRSQKGSKGNKSENSAPKNSKKESQKGLHVAGKKNVESRENQKKKKSVSAAQELQQVIKEYEEKMNQFQEKWKDDFEFEAFFESKTLKVSAVLKDNFEGTDLKVNNAITDKRAKAFMKELVEVLKDQVHNIKNMTICFKNCYSLTKAGLKSIFERISGQFKKVEILDLDFSYDRFRLRFKKIKAQYLSLSGLNLKQITLNLRFRPDVREKEIFRLYQTMRGENFQISLHHGIKIVQPLKSFDFTAYIPRIIPCMSWRPWLHSTPKYWDLNNIFPKTFG